MVLERDKGLMNVVSICFESSRPPTRGDCITTIDLSLGSHAASWANFYILLQYYNIAPVIKAATLPLVNYHDGACQLDRSSSTVVRQCRQSKILAGIIPFSWLKVSTVLVLSFFFCILHLLFFSASCRETD